MRVSSRFRVSGLAQSSARDIEYSMYSNGVIYAGKKLSVAEVSPIVADIEAFVEPQA